MAGLNRRVSIQGRMKQLVAAAAILLGSSQAQAAPDAATAEALRLIDAWADAAQTYGRWPALSIAVGQGKEMVWSSGYGHVDAARRHRYALNP